MSITEDGNVGIGTKGPRDPLEVDSAGTAIVGIYSTDTNGSLWSLRSLAATTDPSAVTFEIFDETTNQARIKIDKYGMVTVPTLQISGGADVAEPFHVARAGAARGSVMVIDSRHPGALMLSDRPYDPKVAGVITGAGGISPGIRMQPGDQSSAEYVALSGRVYALAEADSAPIEPGDMLTTSAIPGYCMKATSADRSRGAILGKAMTSLDHGRGLVLVLVSLQ